MCIKNSSPRNSIIREQLRSLAGVCADGFQLKLQVSNLSASLSELCVQLAVFVAKFCDLLPPESVNAPYVFRSDQYEPPWYLESAEKLLVEERT